jgi:hypothetical protein
MKMSRLREKTTATLLIVALMISILSVVIPIQANNSIDTLGKPSHWAVITLYDEFEDYYGELWLKGWYTTEPFELGSDGTINHVIWEVVYSNLPKVEEGDNIFSIHGWYEDGTIKWIHNAKDFNIHLETDFSTVGSPSYDGIIRYVEGKTYGARVHGWIEWNWSWEGNPPFPIIYDPSIRSNVVYNTNDPSNMGYRLIFSVWIEGVDNYAEIDYVKVTYPDDTTVEVLMDEGSGWGWHEADDGEYFAVVNVDNQITGDFTRPLTGFHRFQEHN